ncbi:MAG TPA: acyl carrier protein [Candidatus Binatus sp.]|jgi:acyl carrier protein|nr:acyl carrier protein [Candidatus Binatus sp.]
MDELTERLRTLVAQKLNAAAERIRPDTDLVADLGADSLAIVEIMMAVEDELGVLIQDDEAERVRTFADAVALIAGKQDGTHPAAG